AALDGPAGSPIFGCVIAVSPFRWRAQRPRVIVVTREGGTAFQLFPHPSGEPLGTSPVWAQEEGIVTCAMLNSAYEGDETPYIYMGVGQLSAIDALRKLEMEARHESTATLVKRLVSDVMAGDLKLRIQAFCRESPEMDIREASMLGLLDVVGARARLVKEMREQTEAQDDP
ncbi:MAG: hypothetical protein ACREMD_11470, partial [Gemmatimonadota bacterium]